VKKKRHSFVRTESPGSVGEYSFASIKKSEELTRRIRKVEESFKGGASEEIANNLATFLYKRGKKREEALDKLCHYPDNEVISVIGELLALDDLELLESLLQLLLEYLVGVGASL